MSASQLPPGQGMASWSVNLATRFHRYRALLKRRSWILIFAVSLGILIAAFRVAQMVPTYVSLSRMWVSPRYNLAENSSYSEELSNFFGTQIEIMQSGEVRNRAEARVRSMHPEMAVTSVDLGVMQQPKTSIFVLRAEGKDSQFTQVYLNAVMEEFMNFKSSVRSQTSETMLSSITEELVRLEKELRAGEDALQQFQRENNVVFMQEMGNSAGLYLAKLKNQLDEMKTEYELLQNLTVEQNLDRRVDQADVPPVPAPVPTTNADGTSSPDNQTASYNDRASKLAPPETDYLQARQSLRMLQADIEDLSRYLKPRHPKLLQLKEKLVQEQRMLEIYKQQSVDQMVSRRESLKLQIDNLEQVTKQKEAEALDLSGRMADFQRLKSNVDRDRNLYERLLGSVQTLDVSRNIDQDTVRVMEQASPAYPNKPGQLQAILIGLMGGLCVGLGILFLLDRMDDRINSFIELQGYFQETVLGQIPREKAPSGHLELLHEKDDRHVFSESYRNVRSSLTFMDLEGERPKTLLITSAIPGEGKSTVTANLAITLALSGSKVLLVDADLRRGRLHEEFGVNNQQGLADVLNGRVSYEKVVFSTTKANLFLLPRGKTPDNAGELFLASATDDFLKAVYPLYDLILFDSAPILATDDTTSLAPKIDGILFVLRASYTSARLSRNALELLYQRQVNVLGLIFNSVDTNLPEYYHYQYREYYRDEGKSPSTV